MMEEARMDGEFVRNKGQLCPSLSCSGNKKKCENLRPLGVQVYSIPALLLHLAARANVGAPLPDKETTKQL